MKQIIQTNTKLFDDFFYLEDLYPLKNNSFKKKNIGINLIIFFFNLIKVIIKFFINFKLKQNKLYFKEKVFFSHINPSFLIDKKEKYFGNLISDNRDILYINHTKKHIITDEFQVFPKSLSIDLEFKIMMKLFKDFIYFLYLIITQFKSKKYYFFFLVNFISPSSVLNLRYYYAIINNFLGKNIQNIFITFEGYAYERAIIKSSKNIGCKIFAYQHGALNKYNISVFYKLNNKLMPNKIFTSGFITYNYFLDKGFSKSEICLLGSNRKKNISIKPILNENYLIIPNGSFVEHEKLYKYILKISQKKQDSKFYFKTHPDKLFNKNYQSKDNLIMVNQFSERLFKNCKYCIYTSSSYVISCINFGMIPLFFNYKGYEDNILVNFNDYIEIKENDNYEFDINAYNKIKMKLSNFADNYYTDLDVDKFNTVLNN